VDSFEGGRSTLAEELREVVVDMQAKVEEKFLECSDDIKSSQVH
jgi:hypothetical protein